MPHDLSHGTLFCPVRKIEVQKTPEEIVRQKLVISMLSELGYPQSLLVVEKKLSQLPSIQSVQKKRPNRRIDILCYASLSTLEPLLLIECKANRFGAKELRQLLGYNYFIGARFVALCSDQKVSLVSQDGQELFNHFPLFSNLLALLTTDL